MTHQGNPPEPVIGIFDSGVGGLTVTKAIMNRVPATPIIYFGDTARFPYGSKSPETIKRYSVENAIFLMERGASMIVIACNTATSVALDQLRKIFSIPIIGVIEPAAAHAVASSANKKIGVIGTSGTIRSKSYESALHALDPGIEIFSKACPLLVTLIEEGAPHPSLTRKIVASYINPLMKKGIDTLLLGCTHYPLLKKEIQKAVGNNITLIDPAEAVSAYLESILSCSSSKTPHTKKLPAVLPQFYVSDDSHRFQKSGKKFLGIPLKAHLRQS